MGAIDTRLVGLEVQTNVATLKTAVDALKTSVDAINTVSSAWVLNGADGLLPTELAVKEQLAAYDALSINVSKPTNTLTDSLSVIRAAV